MSNLQSGIYRGKVHGKDASIMYVTTPGDPCVFYYADGCRGAMFDGLGVAAAMRDARPLVVLDINDPAAVVKCLRAPLTTYGIESTTTGQTIAKVADQIEAQTGPPRIPEPGQWGVIDDHDGFTWIRDGGCVASSKEWICSEDGSRADWADLANPVLIREGVQP